MKKLLLLSILLLLLSIIVVKAQNPFAEYNYTPKIATLSKGQFNEFHDQDTVVQIGSVLYNAKSKQIVAFVETDTVYSEATLEADVVSRWISPDPLADHPNQIGQSPYQYAWNNPVYWTDPDGRCPWCVVWAAVEIGLAVYDAYETGATIIDPNASLSDKLVSAGGFALGAVLPGGGYGKGAKETVKAVDKVVDAGKVIKQNQKAGAAREVLEKADLEKMYPNSSVQSQRYLRDADGKIVKDPITGEGRKVDFGVVKDGKALDMVETTSQTANKTKQIDKENRIREAGGTFIKNKETKKLVDVKNVPTRVSRKD